MSTLQDKAKKISKKSEEILDQKISQSQALELLSYAEGFNNSNIAKAKEKEFIANILKMESSFSLIKNNFGQHEKINLKEDKFTHDDLAIFLREANNLRWNIKNNGATKKNGQIKIYSFYLESDLFSIYVDSISETLLNKEDEENPLELKNDGIKLMMAMLMKPINNKVLSILNNELIIKEAKKHLLNNKITWFLNKGQIDNNFSSSKNVNSLNDLRDKKLFNKVIKDLKNQKRKFVNDYILSDLGLDKEAQENFWNHTKKFLQDKLYLVGDCPHCGSTHYVYYSQTLDGEHWENCEEGLGEFEFIEDAEKKGYHYCFEPSN